MGLDSKVVAVAGVAESLPQALLHDELEFKQQW
jgi:hypothetical protein